MKKIHLTLSALFLLVLSGCGLWPWGDDQAAYERVEPGKPLEIPPGLSDPVNDPSMNVPATTGPPLSVSAEPPQTNAPPVLSVPAIAVRDLPRNENGVPYLLLDDQLASAWRRTGLALERSGFTIGERDRTRWLYSIAYFAPAPKDEDDGFFGWLFGDDEETNPASGEFQVSLVGDGPEQTRVLVLNLEGNPVKSTAAEQILSLLANRLLI